MGTTVVFPANLIIYSKPLEFEVAIEGELLSTYIEVDPLELEISLEGVLSGGVLVSESVLELILEFAYDTRPLVQAIPIASNFVHWSKIGNLDFTIDESNEAGKRPLDWRGSIYKILKLDKVVVVYGENGVSVLTASGVSYGLQTIHRIGLVCKTAAVGTDDEHYFIDKTNKLYKVSNEGLRMLDYSEYLGQLTNPVMSIDLNTGIIYICDGTIGYVYSTKVGSLGIGPATVTGYGVQSSQQYIVASDEIEVPKFYIATDIYDMGTRKPKTIQSIEVGTDLTDRLEAMIEGRISNKDPFIQSEWILVNPSGIAYIPCYGIEFKIHLRSFIYEYLELDYLKVRGVVHGANYLETLG